MKYLLTGQAQWIIIEKGENDQTNTIKFKASVKNYPAKYLRNLDTVLAFKST